MTQNIGLQAGRKGRRMIQPPGGASNLFLSDRTTGPDAPLRSHRTHHEHMRSSIFDGEDYKESGEIVGQSRTAGEHHAQEQQHHQQQLQQQQQQHRPHTPASSMYADTVNTEYVGEKYPSSPQTAPSRSHSVYIDRGGDEESDGPGYRPPPSPVSLGSYRKQTEESRDSMFSEYPAPVHPSDRNVGTYAAAGTTSRQVDAGARGAALTNKLIQSHRGFNVLTGQSNVEEETSRNNDKYFTSRKQEKDSFRSSNEHRPPAGLVAGGRINRYIRGRPHDSGPLW